MSQLTFWRQLTVVLSLALTAAMLALTVGLWETSRRTLAELLDVAGRYTWLVTPPPTSGTFFPLQPEAAAPLAEMPGVVRLAFSTGTSRTPMAFSYPTESVSPEYFALRRLELAAGRAFAAPGEAVVGWDYREHLSEVLDIGGGRRVMVVGVLASVRARGGPDHGVDATVFLPLQGGMGFVNRLYLEATPEAFPAVGEALQAWLEQHAPVYQRARLAEQYGIELRETTGRLLGGALLFGVAAVLFAAGSNLLAFFYARALERLRSVAVRRAVGATPHEIFREELAAALPYALVGAALGLPLAALAAWAARDAVGALVLPGPLTLAATLLGLVLLVLTAQAWPVRWAVSQPPGQVMRGALQSLPQRRLALAGVGLVLGVAGLVVQASAAKAATLEVERLLGRMGERLVIYSSFLRVRDFEDPRGVPQLTRADYQALLDSPAAQAFSRTGYLENYLMSVSGPAGTYTGFMSGFAGDALALTGLELLSGRLPDGNAPELLLGEALAQTLFGSAEALGERVTLFGREYPVVGVFRSGAEANVGNVSSDRALLPLGAVPGTGRGARADILVEVARGRSVAEVAEAGAAFLGARHAVPGLAPVQPHTPDDLAPPVRGALEQLRLAYLWLAAVLLLLGGSGLAAQLFMAVSLRRREIGIRRAVGATPRRVWGQFVGEALRLAVVCGVLGVLVGVAAAFAVARSQGVAYALDAGWGLAAALTALVVSALFSLAPAAAAASVSPAVAMREREA